MAKKSFAIVGIAHHDFAGCRSLLMDQFIGTPVILSIEKHNSLEANAVIAYIGPRHLGYVRTATRHEAYAFIQSPGRISLIGTITRVEDNGCVVWVTTEDVDGTYDVQEEQASEWTSWNYQGVELPLPEAVTRLRAIIQTLITEVQRQEPWDRFKEEMLKYLITNGWQDFNIDTTKQLQTLIEAVATRRDEAEYNRVENQLLLLHDKFGSPEYRRMQAKAILDFAQSQEMNKFLLRYENEALQAVTQLPRHLYELFMLDGENCVGKLYYLRLTSNQIHALTFLLSLRIALENQVCATASDELLQAWKNKWDPNHTKSIAELTEMQPHNPPEEVTEVEVCYPHKGDYKGVTEWLIACKKNGVDYYAQSNFNRAEMCRVLTDLFGWEVNRNTIGKHMSKW